MNRHVVGDRLDLLKNVGRDEDGLVTPELFDVVAKMANLVRVQPRGGLVHNEDVRIVKKRLREPDALAQAARQLADGFFQNLVERTQVANVVDLPFERRRVELARLAEELEKLERRHIEIERTVLGQIAESLRRRDPFFVDIESRDPSRGLRSARDSR